MDLLHLFKVRMQLHAVLYQVSLSRRATSGNSMPRRASVWILGSLCRCVQNHQNYSQVVAQPTPFRRATQ